MADLVRPMNEEMIYDAEEAMFHSSLRYACGRLDQVTTQLFEERENGYLTEAGSHASLVEQIDRFFQSIIAAFKRFKTSIQDKLNAKVRTKEMQQAFRQFAVNVQFLQAQGQKTVEMYDIWKIDKLLDDAWKDLYKMANRILTKRYKSLAAMDVDIRVFNERLDRAEREFNACLEKKVRVPIKDAIDLIEKPVEGEFYAHVFACSVLFNIGIRQKEALAGEIVELEKVVFGIGEHTVKGVDKAGNAPAFHHNVGGVQVAVDKACTRGFFKEYIVEFLPCRLRRAQNFGGEFAVFHRFIRLFQYIKSKRLVEFCPA